MVRTSEVGKRLARLKFLVFCMYFTDTEFIVGLSCKFSWKYVSQFRHLSCWQMGVTKKQEWVGIFSVNQILKKFICLSSCRASHLKRFNQDQIFSHICFFTVRYVTLRSIACCNVSVISNALEWVQENRKLWRELTRSNSQFEPVAFPDKRMLKH
jgi:hypothetical protein